MLREIATCLANVTTGAAELATAYLKRLGLATLLDLAMSLSPAPPSAAERSDVLRAVLGGSVSMGVGEPILLWFSPNSITTSGAACVVDPYGAVPAGQPRIRELFIDPVAVPGIWRTGHTWGANEAATRAGFDAVLAESFSSCAASDPQRFAEMREPLRAAFGLATPTATGPAPDPGIGSGSANPPPAPPIIATAAAVLGPAPAVTRGASGTELARGAATAVPGTIDTKLPAPHPGQAAKPPPTSADEADPAAAGAPPVPRALVGWSELATRWTAVGRLVSGDDVVALDLVYLINN